MEEAFGLDINKGSWDMLAPHFARGALFLAASTLELRAVGEAIAKDQASTVAAWLESSELKRPSDEDVAQWAQQGGEEFAHFIIVQPYVIIQLIN